MATALMSATTSPPMQKQDSSTVHLPSMVSMSPASQGQYLQHLQSGPSSAPLPLMRGRGSSLTDPEMHAHASGLSDAGSRPGSSHASFDRRESTVDEMLFNHAQQQNKRKVSEPEYPVEGQGGEQSGDSSTDLNKRRSSTFSTTANRLDTLSLNQRRSSASSAYSTTSSSAGWSPGTNHYAGWQGATPGYAFGTAAPYVAPHAFPTDAASQAPRPHGQLSEQLAQYGFPGTSALNQNISAIGPITARRGSVPVLGSGSRQSIASNASSGSDPRRVFGKDDDDLSEDARSRAASVDDTNMSNGGGGHGPTGQSPYSRSPELRVSHKLAERKRRKEMTQLFDELRESVPTERGNRSSKWETLVKAIDFIQHLKEVNEELQRDNELMRAHIGIPSRGSGSLPFLGTVHATHNAAAASAAAAAAAAAAMGPPGGHIPLPAPPHADQQASYVYGAQSYVPHSPLTAPPAWANMPGAGQQTPRPGAPYMNAPPGTASSQTSSS